MRNRVIKGEQDILVISVQSPDDSQDERPPLLQCVAAAVQYLHDAVQLPLSDVGLRDPRQLLQRCQDTSLQLLKGEAPCYILIEIYKDSRTVICFYLRHNY